MPPDPEELQRRNLATWLSVIMVLGCGMALLGLAAVVWPSMMALPALIFVFGFIGFWQYVLWGWKLDRDRRMDDD